MIAQNGVWDLFTFIAYMSIPLEILVFAFGLHRKFLNGNLTAGKLTLLGVAFLFVAFIVCCGITHFLSFLHALECDRDATLSYCLSITQQGPMSSTISFFKATTAVVSCVTAVVLGLVMKQLLQFLALFSLLDSHVEDVEDTLRVMLSSTDIYSTHECPDMSFRSISESGHWILGYGGVALPRLRESNLYDLVAEVDRARVRRQIDDLLQPKEPSEMSSTDDMSQSLLMGDLEMGRNRSVKLVERKKESQRIEFRLKGPDEQRLKWVESCFVYDAQFNVVHVVTRDIEARKDEERRRAEARAIESAQDTVQRWLHYMSCVAHDLKTPLTCFEMAVDEIAQDEGISSDSRCAIAHAKAACGVLRSTVAQAIEVRSSVSSGIKPTPRHTETDLSQLFATIDSMIPALSISKAIKVLFHVSPELPRHILSDKGFLMQMCLNLVSNSCKYTTVGSVTTRALPATAPDKPDRVLRVEVQDTGVGMRPESTAKLFEPFYLAQQGQGTGTGLGLYSVKLHAEALGGRCGYLPVPAEQGTGSIFFFEIPLVPIESSVDERLSSAEGDGDRSTSVSPVQGLRTDPPTEATPASTSATNGLGDGQPLSVKKAKPPASRERAPKPVSAEVMELRERVRKCLVVDDVDSIRKLLSARLRRIAPDLAIETGENGLEGLNKWKAAQGDQRFDLIITDVVMPLMSGPEMVARVREAESKEIALGHTPIVGMSANTAPTDVQEFLDTGMDGFMTKPMPSSSEELVKGLLAAMP